jgi:hypothetical protein
MWRTPERDNSMAIHHIAKNGLKVVTAALIAAAIAQLLANMTLGDNQIYQLGVSFGETLREADDEGDSVVMDLKDLDAELEGLGEQLGDSPMVGKLLNDDFAEGATYGYYKSEILGG